MTGTGTPTTFDTLHQKAIARTLPMKRVSRKSIVWTPSVDTKAITIDFPDKSI